MKESNIYGTLVESTKNIQKTISRSLGMTSKNTGFPKFLFIVIGIFILVTIIIKAVNIEYFTYESGDRRIGDRLTGKIKNIKGSHLEKKCYGSTGIYYGNKVPKNIEGFSVNDDRRIMDENLTGDIKNIKGSHLEKKCYGSTGIYYGNNVPKNIEGFSVNDYKRITYKNKLKEEYCCCRNGHCLRLRDCAPAHHLQ